jgi:hypothetical protein
MASQGPSSDNEIKLCVAEAKMRDIGLKIARVDSWAMRDLGLGPGDIIQIIGKKSTVAIVWPPYKEDDGMGLIRIDGEIRKNAGVEINDYVTISKADAKPATKIVLVPVNEPLSIIGDITRIIRGQLLRLPVMKGDVCVIRVLDMTIEFMIISTVPTGSVIVTEDTEIEIHTTSSKLLSEGYSEESSPATAFLPLSWLSENDLIEHFISGGVIDGWYEREVKVGSRIISMGSDVFRHGQAVFDWRRSIDLVYHTRDYVWVIEAKRALNFEAIGQVIVYSTLYAEEHPTKIIKRGIVCYSVDEELVRVCKKNGITVFQVKPDGTIQKYE